MIKLQHFLHVFLGNWPEKKLHSYVHDGPEENFLYLNLVS